MSGMTPGEYDARWRDIPNPHGEADFVEHLGPRTVLDAGCGTGRVAIELARRGMKLVGVDRNSEMIEAAKAKAPGLEWIDADLATLALGRTFDVVVMAGNVMIFTTPGTEKSVVSALARHLEPDGSLVAGFQVGPRLSLETYDLVAEAAGLTLSERYATWDREPYSGGDYAVSVHRLRS